MEMKKSCTELEGCPVAMAYVPEQFWTETYSDEEGLCKGTIFPCLYKPFLGRRGR